MIKSVMIIVRHLIYGGTERYTLNLVNSLIERGISVILVTSGGPLTSYIAPNAKIFLTPVKRQLKIREITQQRILSIAAKYRPQIIHTQCRTSLVCSQLARAVLNIPVVTHEHHMYEQRHYPFIINELDTFADKIVTVGPYTSRKLIKYGIAKEKVVTILNGVDINKILPITKEERQSAREQLNLKKSDKVIVCLSRIDPGKGIDKLAMGFLSVIQKIPHAKLIIAGDEENGITKSELRKFIWLNNLQKKLFLFPGEYNIRKYHAVADIFCYPSIGKGMAVMEAMAAGLPVVAKKTTRKPLVLEHNISGLMTDSTPAYFIDPDQIAEKISYLLKRPALLKKMGKAARSRIENKFKLDDSVENLLRVYKQVVQFHKLLPAKETMLVYLDKIQKNNRDFLSLPDACEVDY